MWWRSWRARSLRIPFPLRSPCRCSAPPQLKTGWPAYIGRVLGAASTIINEVEHNGKSVIVHCSDGWDRTAQLCAVPQLCLDPYYRTMVGFRVLVQREWNSFGHKFRDRTWGHKPHERSPIFLQFIDCVQNMMIKYPCAFEFNEWFLRKNTRESLL